MNTTRRDFAKGSVLTLGLMGFGKSDSGKYAIQPGLSYSRFFDNDGWYGLIGYSLFYKNDDEAIATSTHPDWEDWEHQYHKGWKSGEILLGTGKVFQWESLGLNIDGGFAFSTDEEFFRPLGFRAGIGGSYRFHLK